MIFIDTDLGISFLSKKKNSRCQKAKIVLKELFESNKKVYLTVFNYAELLRGAYISSKVASNIRIIEEFAKRFTIVDFNFEAIEIYAKIYADLKLKGKGIGDFDELIASIVMANEGTLYTNNVEHFDRIRLLKLKDWIK